MSTEVMMAAPQSEAPPPVNVLAYNANSDRGWNDPPTLAFNSSTSTRQRLNLRKRVGHDINSSAIIQGMTGLQMGGQAPTLPGSSYSPGGIGMQRSISAYGNGSAAAIMNGHIETSGTHTPPPEHHSHYGSPPYVADSSPGHSHMHHAASMPNLHHSPGTIAPSLPAPPTVTTQNTSLNGVGPPVYPTVASQRTTTPSTSNFQNVPLYSGPPVYPVAQPPFVSPVSRGETTNNCNGSTAMNSDSGHVGKPLFYFASQDVHPAVRNAVTSVANGPRSNADITASEAGRTYSSANTTSSQYLLNPGVIPSEGHAPSHHRSSSLPDMAAHAPQPASGPAGPPVGPPPVEGYYTRRASSADPSGQRTPSPAKPDQIEENSIDIIKNESELLTTTVEKLESCAEECLPLLTVKLSEDIKRRIQILKQQWINKRLSNQVKLRMASLAKALSTHEHQEADKIHKTLIVDYPGEVSQWMVGIKKLISTSQEMAVVNNQY